MVPVRLALFAEMVGEMVGGRPWTPATLREVGGTEGVGVTFLEKTLDSSKDDPITSHQKAAQCVLKALLPESGTKSRATCGHTRNCWNVGIPRTPKAFDDLLRILDSETRLITPTDPEGIERGGGSNATRREAYYQLTHDYLVPSIREWLTRKQKETRRGRAELRLAERSVSVERQAREPPPAVLWEWANIRLLTRKKDWTEPQAAR